MSSCCLRTFVVVVGGGLALSLVFGNVVPMRAADPSIVVTAYGDTRTGVWGLGDNKKQRTHKVVVEALLKAEPIDAVIFTGDAVMTTFPLWRKKYFSAFFEQTKQIVRSGTAPRIPFYPSLGNHETYTNRPLMPVSVQRPAPGAAAPSSARPESQVSGAYDRGEEAAAVQGGPRGSVIDFRSKAGEAQLEKWEKDIEKGNPAAREEAAFGLGQFEGALQKDFHDQPSEQRCVADGQIFFTNYVGDAGYKYLDPFVQGGTRSFYAADIKRGERKVRLIALDTNCLDYPPQLEFFKAQVENFDGIIIVFGHHPPIREEDKTVMPWDIVPGWNLYKPYFSGDYKKRIPLWVFGHVHNYQRANAPSSTADRLQAPVLVIAGGGGASDLNAGIGPNQWFPDGWAKPTPQAVYNFVQISIGDAIEVTAHGTASRDTPFTRIDHFFIDR